MGSATLINSSLLIQIVFQKHDELFTNNQKLLKIFHITVQNTCQLCDNWSNISGGPHHILKLAVVDTSTTWCQKSRSIFDDTVTIF